MKDRMNGATTYVKKDAYGAYMPTMKLEGLNEYAIPGAKNTPYCQNWFRL